MPAGEVNETQDEEKHDHIGDDATTYHVIKSKKVKITCTSVAFKVRRYRNV